MVEEKRGMRGDERRGAFTFWEGQVIVCISGPVHRRPDSAPKTEATWEWILRTSRKLLRPDSQGQDGMMDYADNSPLGEALLPTIASDPSSGSVCGASQNENGADHRPPHHSSLVEQRRYRVNEERGRRAQ